MTSRRKPFYLIGHNPNSVPEAQVYLERGANALAPDIVHKEGKYYVSHAELSSYSNKTPLLEDYLLALKALLATRRFPLALIIWDLKMNDFDINHFISVIKKNFSGDECDGIAMVVTHATDLEFISNYNGAFSNIGVGVDESNIKPDRIVELLAGRNHHNIAYADGITTLLKKPEVSTNIRQAIIHRYRSRTNHFKLIYPWVLRGTRSIKKFLGCYVDGIMVDPPEATELSAILLSQPYSDVYELAKPCYNPFVPTSSTLYLLRVTTKDKFLAGTNAILRFTIHGSSGSLQSLPFDADLTGTFQRGSVTELVIEGDNVEQVNSLTVEMLTGGVGSRWLPEKIDVEGPGGAYTFNLNADSSTPWISKKRGPITYPLIASHLV